VRRRLDRIPLVRRKLAEVFDRAREHLDQPGEVVAQGAAIQAGSLTTPLRRHRHGRARCGRDHRPLAARTRAVRASRGRREAPVLLDVNPATLAIHTAGGFTERLLARTRRS